MHHKDGTVVGFTKLGGRPEADDGLIVPAVIQPAVLIFLPFLQVLLNVLGCRHQC